MLGFHFARAQPGRRADQACRRCWTSWPAFQKGAITDRRRRRKTALGVLSALKFAAYKFQVEQLQSVLESPFVAAWQNSAEWTRQRVKEALPLPLVVLFRFEQALVKGTGEDCLLLSVLLVMAWASLRRSDMQRLDLASVVLGSDHLAGWCWRTKSSKRGMPWGCLSCGFKSFRILQPKV